MNIPLTGIDHIDHDHTAVMEMLDKVITQLENEATPFSEIMYTDAMLRILDYCSRHMRDEEALMRSVGYPCINLHLERHQEVTKLIKSYLHQTMERKMTRRENIVKCRALILDHISDCDMHLAFFCKTAKPPEEIK